MFACFPPTRSSALFNSFLETKITLDFGAVLSERRSSARRLLLSIVIALQARGGGVGENWGGRDWDVREDSLAL